jgi:hypothetical protein
MLRALLLATALIASSTLAPPRQPTGGAPHASTRYQTAKEEPKPFWKRTLDDPVSAFTGVLALLTGVLATVSIVQIKYLIRADRRAAEASDQASKQFLMLAKQVDTMEKQKEIARTQFFADHRPRLLLRDVFFSRPDNFEEVIFEMSNVGESMAIVTGGFIAVDFVSDPRQFKEGRGRSLAPLDNAGFKAGQLRPFGIRPNQDTQRGLEYWRDRDVTGVKADRRYGTEATVPVAPLYFFGVVYYADGRGEEFGTTHVAVFRREWDSSESVFRRTGNTDHEYSD